MTPEPAAPPVLDNPPAPPVQSSRIAAAAPRRAPAGSEGGRQDGVGPQLEALAEVRSALLAGQPGRALELLDGFDRRYRASPLAEEVALLRIDALLDAGRGAEAAAIGQAFLTKHPGSAYAQHIRSRLKSP